ncbi:MAG: precorrin-3B C(17)-methyltransferase, partial [Pseudorhodobacter sp.]|nr:precorrin-3B C(17)-methyltransferase [Frankiaceae bacterium]
MNPQNPSGRIGVVAVTAAGRTHAATLCAAWPEARVIDEGSAADSLASAWTSCDAVVVMLATGATVRLAAPLLTDKHLDPAVVCVDEAARFAVALLGAHHGGNTLARAVADVLGAEAVVTTATDAVGALGLDTLGLPVEGDVAAVGRAVLDGAPVRYDCDGTQPLPAFPAHVRADVADPVAVLRVDDRAGTDGDLPTAVLRPASLVVGVGSSRGVAATEVLDLVAA